MYQIRTTKLFDRRFANLKKCFGLKDDETRDAIEAIKYTMILLQRDGKLQMIRMIQMDLIMITN